MSDAIQQVLTAASFEALFTDATTLASRYRDLAKEVHPDHGGDEAAFARLVSFYHEAQARVAEGWAGIGRLELLGTDGTRHRIRYQHEQKCGLATAYHATEFLTYSLPADASDLAERGQRAISGLKMPSARMEKGLRQQLSEVVSYFHTERGPVMVVRKPAELVRLSDLLAHVGGRLDPRHVTWVVSRALNLCCYLEWAKLAHNDMSLLTLYAEPAHHSLTLLGGWWHAVGIGDQLPRLLPGRTVNELPSKVRSAKRASPVVDLLLVRRLARELLGDPDGSKLRTTTDIPAAFLAWLTRVPATDSAIRDFEDWQKVLDDSFGARRFVELNVKASDIYQTKE